MKATPEQQRRLLDVVALDARINRAMDTQKNPPHVDEVKALIAQRQEQTHVLSGQMAQRDDLRTELKRVEADIEVVEARISRDEKRLEETDSVKEVQGFESEIVSLKERRGVLDTSAIELMEKIEILDSDITNTQQQIDDINRQGAQLSQEAKDLLSQAKEDHAAAQQEKKELTSDLPEQIVSFYEKLAKRGAGAAALNGKTCEGCHMELADHEISELRSADEDVIITCTECGCILVRTV